MNSPSNKPRRKRNAIWSIDKATLEKATKEATSLNKILLSLGLDNRSGSYKTLKARLQFDGIEYPHIAVGLNHNKGKSFVGHKTPLEEILVEGSTFSRCHLKIRLIEEGLLKEKCSRCGLLPEWYGEKL